MNNVSSTPHGHIFLVWNKLTHGERKAVLSSIPNFPVSKWDKLYLCIAGQVEIQSFISKCTCMFFNVGRHMDISC